VTPVLDVRGFSKQPAAFREELVRVASRLGLDPSPLAAVMSIESSFRPDLPNPHTGAMGLIQFMPATAIGLGTTVEALAKMTALEQLRFVEKYYRPLASRMKTPGDYYMATFMPARTGDPPETVLFRLGQTGYEQNQTLDLDRDGLIRIEDVTRTIENRLAEARGKPPVLVDVDVDSPAPKDEAAVRSGSASPLSPEGFSTASPAESPGDDERPFGDEVLLAGAGLGEQISGFACPVCRLIYIASGFCTYHQDRELEPYAGDWQWGNVPATGTHERFQLACELEPPATPRDRLLPPEGDASS
jgi:hypothetical protein